MGDEAAVGITNYHSITMWCCQELLDRCGASSKDATQIIEGVGGRRHSLTIMSHHSLEKISATSAPFHGFHYSIN